MDRCQAARQCTKIWGRRSRQWRRGVLRHTAGCAGKDICVWVGGVWRRADCGFRRCTRCTRGLMLFPPLSRARSIAPSPNRALADCHGATHPKDSLPHPAPRAARLPLASTLPPRYSVVVVPFPSARARSGWLAPWLNRCYCCCCCYRCHSCCTRCHAASATLPRDAIPVCTHVRPPCARQGALPPSPRRRARRVRACVTVRTQVAHGGGEERKSSSSSSLHKTGAVRQTFRRRGGAAVQPLPTSTTPAAAAAHTQTQPHWLPATPTTPAEVGRGSHAGSHGMMA